LIIIFGDINNFQKIFKQTIIHGFKMHNMRLNNIQRTVDVCEPTDIFPGVYNTDANYQGPLEQLDRARLFEALAEEGLTYSGVDHDIQHGFNDVNAMGVEEAAAAKTAGKSHVWIGLDGRVVNLEVLPATIQGLQSETHLEYAQRILEQVVTFVETPKNYQK
jgi:hypothetical protein